MALAEKPAKMAIWIAPILAHASMAATDSMLMDMYIATGSPLLTPSPLSAAAYLFTSERSCA